MYPDFRALFLRKTFPELREVMDRTQGVFKRAGAEWIASEKRWRFPSGSYFEFGYCESWADVQQYQGQQFQYIGFDELGLIPEERIWLFLMSRCRSVNPEIMPMMRASANPGGPGHGWLKKRFITVCPPDGTVITLPPLTDDPNEVLLTRAYVHAKVWDNPSLVQNDPQYITILRSLPDTLRKQLLEGDWDTGTGLAFENLSEGVHIVPQRAVEPWENVFASFDWGYSHKFSAGLYLIQADGAVVKMDTISGRRLIPEEIVERVKVRFGELDVPFHRLQYSVSGSDVKARERARGNWGPSVAEQFYSAGWSLINGDQARVAGYQNLLRYLHYKPGESTPLLTFMDTPGNRKCFEQLKSMTVDPDSPNDVLKMDVDPMTGEGGDDMYDETRMALMSRPLVSKKPRLHIDRINQERIFAKPPEEPRETTPWAARHPGLITQSNRTERIV